uniref:Late competence development protein ComFB n=1 Tax=Syphacia muris TaxID=451379 RepID=A0A0N5ATH3_9BILA
MSRDELLRVSTNASISQQIRHEIQRFESVHPCIYTVYDLIELIPDAMIQDKLREQIVHIEEYLFERYKHQPLSDSEQLLFFASEN